MSSKPPMATSGPVTAQELETVAQHLKNEDFRKAFFEYMQDLADPATRAEQEEYLRQLEARQSGVPPEGDPLPHSLMPDLPPDMRLIRPEPGFAFRTRAVGGTSAPEDVFVNVVCHAAVEKPAFERPADGKGRSVRLPMLVGPTRLVNDEDKKPVLTLDVCVHPDAVALAERDISYRQMVISSACDHASQRLSTLQKSGEKDSKPYKLSEKDVKPLKEKCVGGAPATMSVRTTGLSADAAVAAAAGPASAPASKPVPKPTPAAEPAAPAKHKTVVRRPGDAPVAMAPAGGDAAEQTPTPLSATAAAVATAAETPRYTPTGALILRPEVTITERGHFELADNFQGPAGAASARSTRPRELAIKITTPLAASARVLNCDIHPDRVTLTSDPVKVPLPALLEAASRAHLDVDAVRARAQARDTGAPFFAVYDLDHPLPYPVQHESPACTAKYDVAKRALTLTVPVVPAAALEVHAATRLIEEHVTQDDPAVAPAAPASAPEPVGTSAATVPPGITAGTQQPRANSKPTAAASVPQAGSVDTSQSPAISSPAVDSASAPSTPSIPLRAGGVPAYRFAINDDAVTVIIDVPHVEPQSMKVCMTGIGARKHAVAQRSAASGPASAPTAADFGTMGDTLEIDFAAACAPEDAAAYHRSVSAGYGFSDVKRTDSGASAVHYSYKLSIQLFAPAVAALARWDVSDDNVLISMGMPSGMPKWPQLLRQTPQPAASSATVAPKSSTSSASAVRATSETAAPAAPAPAPQADQPASSKPAAAKPSAPATTQLAVTADSSDSEDDVIEMDAQGRFDLTRPPKTKPKPAPHVRSAAPAPTPAPAPTTSDDTTRAAAARGASVPSSTVSPSQTAPSGKASSTATGTTPLATAAAGVTASPAATTSRKVEEAVRKMAMDID